MITQHLQTASLPVEVATAIALQKTSKSSDRLLSKSECVSVAHRRYRLTESLKNQAIAL
ncbi:hypothetical protein [Nostoc sp.]|uniref:hypothetical protein n=1 Tax=Nostoc sp. TaxID=1180 RepID=UPI002FF55486